MATKKDSCKHEHECEKCIREEITKLEAKLKELKAKLPSPTVINICNHGCSHWPCNHYVNNIYKVPFSITSGANAIYSITSTSSGTSTYNAQS